MCTGEHPFIPAPNTAKVDMVYGTPGGTAVNSYHVRFPTPPSAANLDALITLFDAWDAQMLDDRRATSVMLRMIRAKSLHAEGAPGIEEGINPPRPGTNGSGALPQNVTVAVKWSTGFTGRSARGRTYHIGLANDMVTTDLINDNQVPLLITAYNDLITRVAAIPAELVVVSYCGGGEWRTTAQVTPITAASVENVVDSQRRRLLRRGA